MPGIDPQQGLAVRDAIQKVKYALYVAQVHANGLPYKLGSIDLELKVVQTGSVAGKPTFKVPVLGWEIGGTAAVSAEQTQILAMNLAPPKTERIAAKDVPIDIPITEALLEIADIVKSAAQGDPPLGLGDGGASVELQVAFEADGKLTLLIFEGESKHATTSTLKINLVAA